MRDAAKITDETIKAVSWLGVPLNDAIGGDAAMTIICDDWSVDNLDQSRSNDELFLC